MPSLPSVKYRLVLSRLAVIGSATLVVAILLGCMNICVDRSISVEDGICKQTGTVPVQGAQELDVYYPIAYNTPPNLHLKSNFDDAVPIAQHPDHFRVKNTTNFVREVTWEAKGVRQAPAAVVVPVTTIPVQELPPVPVPISGR